MGVLLQGFYKLGPKRAVPFPADGDPKTPWWWDHLAAQGARAEPRRLHRDLATDLDPLATAPATAGQERQLLDIHACAAGEVRPASHILEFLIFLRDGRARGEVGCK